MALMIDCTFSGTLIGNFVAFYIKQKMGKKLNKMKKNEREQNEEACRRGECLEIEGELSARLKAEIFLAGLRGWVIVKPSRLIYY
nr:hypothetical protein Iba_chr04aCG19740 [Ipomoea batatas]